MDDHNFDDVRTGKKFGYGHWLQPIIMANDETTPVTAEREDEAEQEDAREARHVDPPRRGRGRPRVSKPRNESAVEKRRAQVREAQRTYQKRKDTATETEKRRVDELLQLLSDLSSDVETLLQAASTAGNMQRDDDVSKNIQRLWSTYDTVISNEHVQPELRLLHVKNSKRQAAHQARVDTVPQEQGGSQIVATSPLAFDVSHMNFDLVRFRETTLVTTFPRTDATDQYTASRNIFELVKERQAAMREADRRRAEG